MSAKMALIYLRRKKHKVCVCSPAFPLIPNPSTITISHLDLCLAAPDLQSCSSPPHISSHPHWPSPPMFPHIQPKRQQWNHF
jgi:hypothetical protein